MSQAFYEAVQSALETYACELGAEPWFYAAAGFAAAGQGVGALAATIGGVATATACNKPPGPPGNDQPFVTFDSGPGDGKLYNWQIVTEGSYRSYDQQQGSPTDSFCNYSRIYPLSGDQWRPTVSARRIKLRIRMWNPGGGFCGTNGYQVEQQIDNQTTWTGVAAQIQWTCWEHSIAAWAYKLTAPKPPRPPLPAPPDRRITLNWTENNLNINNDIKIKAPDFIFAPSGDFVLSFPIDVQVGPKFTFPFSFNFDLNYSTGGDTVGGDGYGNKPKGGGPRLPPAERPKECPEIPEDPEISGSWSKADCINGEPLFTPVNWKGRGFSGVADALNKLNSVIGPWQENTYDCDDNLPAEPMVGIPISQYTGATSFEPSITLWFYEPNLLAIQAGRTYRVRRCISVPVATPPANPENFLDGEIAYWEGFEWQCGFTTCRASLTGGRSFVLCNAINEVEGERVLTRVLTRYGFAFDKAGGFRATVGASPSDSTGRGGLRIQTTVRFHSASFATMNQTWGPISPDSVYAQGRNKFA